MIGSLDRFVPTSADAEPDTISFFEPWGHNLGGHGLRLSGNPGAVCIEVEGSQITVEGQAYAWDQHWFGPILPVFPVLMGAGPYLSRLTVYLTVDKTPAPLVLAMDEVTVQATGSDERKTPKWSRDPRPGNGAWGPVSVAESSVELCAGEGVWLVYDIDNNSTTAFDLLLPVDGTTVRIRFEQQRTKFLFTLP